MASLLKEPEELLVGDIFLYPDYDKRYHFQVIKITTSDDRYITFNAVLLWANGDGKYYEYGPGYEEGFSFRRGRHTLKILKTTRYGCCDSCLGVLDWVSLALKCKGCGKVHAG